MIFQNLSDYLHAISPIENDTASDAFINVYAENVQDIYLSAISGNSEKEDDKEFVSYHDDFADGANENALNEEEEELSEEEPHPVLDVVRQERQAVILGNPGSGKTTLLKYLQYTMVKNSLEDNKCSDIPVYIPLKELRKEKTLIDTVIEYLQMPLFSDLFQQGRLFFLLDGLNEVQPDIYPSTIAAVNWLIEKNHLCGILITSRLYGYAGQFKLPAYCLEELTEENIQNYILRKTNDSELHRLLSEKENLRDVLKNPLLLSMVVSIWNESHSLPASRTQLYEWFVSYELDKAGINDAEERRDVLNVLSRLAFDMRRFGFISDSYEGLETVISCIVPQDKIAEMTRLLLHSGLLAVTHSDSNFWCISFIHETFQEYFAALYIHQEYQSSGKIVADLSAPEWTDTFKLLIETILISSSEDYIIQFLSDVSTQYLRISGTLYFNDYIGNFANILAICIESNAVVRSWLSQYLLFNMSNFIAMPNSERTAERFKSLLEAVITVGDKDINKLLFCSFRWLAYWLYSHEEIDQHTCTNNEIFNVMFSQIKMFPDKTTVYMTLQTHLNKFSIFECINTRCRQLLLLLSENLNKDESRNFYVATGDIAALLGTGDWELIKQETEGKSGLFIPNLKRWLPRIDQQIVRFIYAELFDKLCEPNKEILLSLEVLPDMLMKVSGLNKRILSRPEYEMYRSQLLKACYVIPDEWLSPDYFNLIKSLRENTSAHLKTIHLKTLTRDADNKFYIDSTGADDMESEEKISNTLKLDSIEATWIKMQCNYFNVIERGEEIDTEDCIPISSNNDIFPAIRGNSLLLLVKGNSSYKSKNTNLLYSYTLDGITFKITLVKKTTKVMMYADQPVDRTLYFSNKEKEENAFFLENYYLYRLKDFTPSQWEYIETLDNDMKATLGVLGHYVSTMEPENMLFGVVRNISRNFSIIQMRDRKTTNRYSHRFYKLTPEEIVVRYRKNIFRIADIDVINRYALVTGRIVSKNGPNFFISTDTKKYAKDYYCYDETNTFSVNDVVRFFPLLNNCQKFTNNPMAYGVKKC